MRILNWYKKGVWGTLDNPAKHEGVYRVRGLWSDGGGLALVYVESDGVPTEADVLMLIANGLPSVVEDADFSVRLWDWWRAVDLP